MNYINKSDKIFVAGARGMAGSSICRALLRAGYGDKKNQGALLTPNSKELDCLDHKKVEQWYEDHNPNVVIIAAAKVGGIEANSKYPADFLLENMKIQNNLIECAWKNGVKRLLFLGSSCIYPKYAQQPISEESLLTGSLEQTNEWYAVAKIAGIKLCEALRRQYGFDAINLMPTNLYGIGDNYHKTNSHVLPALIRRFHDAVSNNESKVTCWGTGSPMREFLFADDLGDACVLSLENWNPSSPDAPKDKDGNALQLLNVGTGIDMTIKSLAETIAEVTKYKGEIVWDTTKPDGTPKKQLNISAIQKIGWQPKTKLRDGIEIAYNDFKKHLKTGTLRS